MLEIKQGSIGESIGHLLPISRMMSMPDRVPYCLLYVEYSERGQSDM